MLHTSDDYFVAQATSVPYHCAPFSCILVAVITIECVSHSVMAANHTNQNKEAKKAHQLGSSKNSF